MLNKLTISIALTASLLIAGCGTSAKKLNEISEGMSKSEVIRILGTPESVRVQSGQEVLIYTLSNSWNNAVWNQTYYVQLQNGKVISYGK